MKPLICKVKSNPPETYGDCIAACIGSILEREDVPHVFDGRSGEEAWGALRQWLKPLGLTIFMNSFSGDFPLEELYYYMKTNNPDCYYMLMATSGGADHMVLCQNDKVVHNPAWYKQGIDAPHSSGDWVIVILAKI